LAVFIVSFWEILFENTATIQC